MNEYEITFITKEPFDTTQGKDQKEKPVKKEIEDLGGKILSVSSIGQKQFVYKIKKETSGVYTTAIFELEPTKVLELNKKLSLNPEILRHLILTVKAIKIEAPKVTKEKLEKPRMVKPLPVVAPKAEIEVPPAKEIIPKAAIKEKSEKAAKKPIMKPTAKPIPKPKPKVSPIEEEEQTREERLKALDKKLEELLKE